MSVALRCSICSLNWPFSVDYKICPICQDIDGTAKSRNCTPLDEDEALSIKLHADFDRFYEDWEDARSADAVS